MIMSECNDCRWFVDEQVTFTVPKCALLGKFTGDARKICAGDLFQVPPPRVPAKPAGIFIDTKIYGGLR